VLATIYFSGGDAGFWSTIFIANLWYEIISDLIFEEYLDLSEFTDLFPLL
jgi:hypothetical protein